MKKDRNSKEIEEFQENIKKILMEISPGLGGLLIGILTPKIYELLSEEQKMKWKETFPTHHGEAGLVLTGITFVIRALLEIFPDKNKYVKIAKKFCEMLIGIGAGLTLEDIKDYNKWFKSEI